MARITTPWTEDELARLVELRRLKHTMAEIGELMQRTRGSVENKISRLQIPYGEGEKQADPEELAGAAEQFKQSALERENESLKKQLHAGRSSAGVVSELGPEDQFDAVAEWGRFEESGARKLNKAAKIGRFSIDFEDGPIIIAAISDQHIGGACDYKRMREDAEKVRDTPGVYAVLVGDGVDNHTKHRSAILAADSKPDDQWRLYDYYLQLFGDSLLVVISGNHDAFTNQVAGVDMLARLADSGRFCYSPASARLAVTVGGFTYQLAIRHQYRFNSQFNQGHTVKRLYDMGDEAFDIGVVAHHHESSLELFLRHGLHRWAARPGSYQRTSAYSKQYGFNDAYPTCPSFVLFPGTRRIVGFLDLADALWAFGR